MCTFVMFNLKLRFSQLFCKYKIYKFHVRNSQNLIHHLFKVNIAAEHILRFKLNRTQTNQDDEQNVINHSYGFCTRDAAAVVFFLQ